jgi:hypothetical protein
MTLTCGRIGDLILRAQDAFLQAPGLRLTVPEAARRFGADETTCRAVLEALVDGRVLDRTLNGAYLRHSEWFVLNRTAGAHPPEIHVLHADV